MLFIDKTYFTGNITLPKSDYDTIELSINVLEKRVLIDLLGYELYSKLTTNSVDEPYKSLVEGKEYEVNYNGRVTKVKWNGFKNSEKISLIAYYVYCYHLRGIISSTQSVGEIKSKQQNSDNANAFGKIFSSWVMFEELYGKPGDSLLKPTAYNFLYAHKNDYPEWIFSELKGSMNSHDL